MPLYRIPSQEGSFTDAQRPQTYGGGTLANGVRSRMIHGVNSLYVHFLEAGYESPGRPLVLLLCTPRPKPAVDHAGNRQWITLESGTATRCKPAPRHAATRQRIAAGSDGCGSISGPAGRQ